MKVKLRNSVLIILYFVGCYCFIISFVASFGFNTDKILYEIGIKNYIKITHPKTNEVFYFKLTGFFNESDIRFSNYLFKLIDFNLFNFGYNDYYYPEACLLFGYEITDTSINLYTHIQSVNSTHFSSRIKINEIVLKNLSLLDSIRMKPGFIDIHNKFRESIWLKEPLLKDRWNKETIRMFTKDDTIDNDYIPEDFDDALTRMSDFFNHDSIIAFASLKEDIAINSHLPVRYIIEDKWHLWQLSRLYFFFNYKGIKLPQTITDLLMRSYHRYLNKKPVELEKLVNRAIKYEDELRQNYNN